MVQAGPRLRAEAIPSDGSSGCLSVPEINHPLRMQRATVNPYRLGLGILLRQLAWDIRPLAWTSRSKMKSWRDACSGQKAVILCNGPSLLNVDFESLRQSGVFCFGLNKINLLFDKTEFRPACVVAVNRLVIEQNAGFYNETELPLFLNNYAASLVRNRSNVHFASSTIFPRFARDCTEAIYEGYTVTFVALQLAFHMGFQEVALVGADHNFVASGPANLAVVSGAKDDSHFDPSYFSGGMKWQLPDLFQSEVSYTLAKNMYEAFDRRVVNATTGGKLEIFERMPLENFLAN